MGQPSPAHVSVYDPGDLLTLRATFVGTDLVTPQDPSWIGIYVRGPWAPTASTFVFGTASIGRLGTGAYFMDFSIPFEASAAGDWQYLWRATGGVQEVQPWTFRVATSKVI